MPVSHQHKLIFVHIPKTGGGSIEKALGIFGVDNIGGNIHCSKILYGYIKAGGKYQEYFDLSCPKKDGFHCCNRGFNRFIKDNFCSNNYEVNDALQHLTISEIQRRKPFLNYYKFAFVRNPFDRLVSEYKWRVGNGEIGDMDFTEFVETVVVPNQQQDRHLRSQLSFVSNRKGQIIVDYIGKYECLERDFNKLLEKFKLDAELPRIHASKRQHYREYYSDQTRQKAATIYADDLRELNYEF